MVLKGSLAYMQHFKFVNWRIRFLMSRTGYWTTIILSYLCPPQLSALECGVPLAATNFYEEGQTQKQRNSAVLVERMGTWGVVPINFWEMIQNVSIKRTVFSEKWWLNIFCVLFLLNVLFQKIQNVSIKRTVHPDFFLLKMQKIRYV